MFNSKLFVKCTERRLIIFKSDMESSVTEKIEESVKVNIQVARNN